MQISDKNIVNYPILILVGILIGMGIMDLIQHNNKSNQVVIKSDTFYNKVKLDSIKVQIGKHDTTIYKLNIKLINNTEKSYQLNDTSTINLFRKLNYK